MRYQNRAEGGISEYSPPRTPSYRQDWLCHVNTIKLVTKPYYYYLISSYLDPFQIPALFIVDHVTYIYVTVHAQVCDTYVTVNAQVCDTYVTVNAYVTPLTSSGVPSSHSVCQNSSSCMKISWPSSNCLVQM